MAYPTFLLSVWTTSLGSFTPFSVRAVAQTTIIQRKYDRLQNLYYAR